MTEVLKRLKKGVSNLLLVPKYMVRKIRKRKKLQVADFRRVIITLAEIEKLEIRVTGDKSLLQCRLMSDLNLDEVDICWIIVELERRKGILFPFDSRSIEDITVAQFLHVFNRER